MSIVNNFKHLIDVFRFARAGGDWETGEIRGKPQQGKPAQKDPKPVGHSGHSSFTPAS